MFVLFFVHELYINYQFKHYLDFNLIKSNVNYLNTSYFYLNLLISNFNNYL